MAELLELRTWFPALEALLRDIPAHVGLVEFTGTAGQGAVGGSYREDGRRAAGSNRELHQALLDVASTSTHRVGVVLRASRGGLREVDVIDLPESVRYDVGEIVGDLILVDGAVPALYRRGPDAAIGTRPVAPSADPDALARLVHRQLPGAHAATSAQLAAAERRLGVPLTDEVRAMFGAAAEGEIVVGDEDGFYGMELIPLDDEETRRWFLPEARMSEWCFGGTETLGPDPQRKIQALGATALWFPVGHDWGGNAYAVDLTPAQNGHRGQVVFLDHERNAGATFVSESFTELLVHGREGETTGPVVGAATAHVNDRNGVSIAEAAANHDLEVVSLGLLDDPVDLAPLLDRPGIRTVASGPGTLAEPRQLTRFPGLEYVSAGVAEWVRLLDGGPLPPTLLAARVRGDDDDGLVAVIATANEVLKRWNRPLIQLTRLR